MSVKFATVLLSIITAGYSVGFDQLRDVREEDPAGLINPIEAHILFLAAPVKPDDLITPATAPYETPIRIRIGAITNDIFWNCLAVYDNTALDILTKKEPLVRANSSIISDLGTQLPFAPLPFTLLDNAKVTCAYYAGIIISNIVAPEARAVLQSTFSVLNLDQSLIQNPVIIQDITACGPSDADCLNQIASDNEYHPEIMGSIVAIQILDWLKDDGWNMYGDINRNGDGVCTANCRPFSDTTGYEPEMCDPTTRWQRLQEDNGKGFFFSYDHVVPHIGFTAKTRILTREDLRERSAIDPDYDYEQESEKVVERLKELATNDTQKILVEFFDDKAIVDTGIYAAIGQLPAFLGSYDNRILFYSGYTSANYDAVITVWREKRIWDLVRPTTLIKDGIIGDEIETYGGPGQGVKTIDAEDFEAYIRVMPHSEYPSASQCICLAGTQFTETILAQFGLDFPFPFTVPNPAPSFSQNMPFEAGSSKIEPGITPSMDINVAFNSFREYADICGESRLWGGMHFDAAVKNTIDLCDGIGTKSFQAMINLKNGNDAAFPDEAYQEIQPFEEAYRNELESTLGKKEAKKRLKGNKMDKCKGKNDKEDKKRQDDFVLPMMDNINDNNKYNIYVTVGINIMVSIITAIVCIWCLRMCQKEKSHNPKYKVVSKESC